MNAMTRELDGLLAPISPEDPVGPALDYDPAFQALERELAGGAEQQYGDVLIPAKQPDWAEVVAQSERLLQRSKDFRFAVARARALTRWRGLPGALAGLELAAALGQQHWSGAHPLLIEEGSNEPDGLPRANALAELVAATGLLGDIRQSMIRSRQMGDVELAVLERVATGREADAEFPIGREDLAQWIADELNAGNEDFRALVQLRRPLAAIEKQCTEGLEPELVPNFASIKELLDRLAPQPVTAEGQGEETELDPVVASADQAASDGAPRQGHSRESAMAALDSVIAFLERDEPSNPAHMLIRRARNLIGKDFYFILKELAPDGVAAAQHITGATES